MRVRHSFFGLVAFQFYINVKSKVETSLTFLKNTVNAFDYYFQREYKIATDILTKVTHCTLTPADLTNGSVWIVNGVA